MIISSIWIACALIPLQSPWTSIGIKWGFILWTGLSASAPYLLQYFHTYFNFKTAWNLQHLTLPKDYPISKSSYLKLESLLKVIWELKPFKVPKTFSQWTRGVLRFLFFFFFLNQRASTPMGNGRGGSCESNAPSPSVKENLWSLNATASKLPSGSHALLHWCWCWINIH